MKRIGDWLVDEATPLATKKGDGWLSLNVAHGQADVEVHFCESTVRMYVPVEVLRALLAAHDARSKPAGTKP